MRTVDTIKLYDGSNIGVVKGTLLVMGNKARHLQPAKLDRGVR